MSKRMAIVLISITAAAAIAAFAVVAYFTNAAIQGTTVQAPGFGGWFQWLAIVFVAGGTALASRLARSRRR
jgi:hypothetical protein